MSDDIPRGGNGVALSTEIKLLGVICTVSVNSVVLDLSDDNRVIVLCQLKE